MTNLLNAAKAALEVLEQIGSGKLVDDLRAAIAEAERAVPEWQPIETAPKDGLSILVFNSKGINEVYWDEENQLWSIDVDFYTPFPLRGTLPTHWMPLPLPPKYL